LTTTSVALVSVKGAGAGLVAQPEMIARLKSTKHPIWARFIWRVIAYPSRQVVIKLKRIV
jgi:hypothetical protein